MKIDVRKYHNNKYFLNALHVQQILDPLGTGHIRACGGFVRDALFDLPFKDIDFATSKTPIEIMKICEDRMKVIPTGLRHGTVTVVYNHSHFEVTTLRKDVVCKGRDVEVEFTDSWEQDASRRDFTINALYADLQTGKVYDPTGQGLKDIAYKVLCFVGDPRKRIFEDFLRIMRFFRFAAKYDFLCPDSQSRCAVDIHIEYLPYIAADRIRAEFLESLKYGICFAFPRKLIYQIIPAMRPTYECVQNCRNHLYDVWSHSIQASTSMAHLTQDEILIFTALIHDVAKPYVKTTDFMAIDHFYGHDEEGARMAGHICESLNFSLKETFRIKFLIANHMRLHTITTMKSIRKLYTLCHDNNEKASIPGFLKADLFNDLLLLAEADVCAMNKSAQDQLDRVRKLVDELVEEMNAKPVPECPLSGHEIMNHLKIATGEKVGQAKKLLKDSVIAGILDVDDKESAYVMLDEVLS